MSELRWNPQLKDWVIVATHRQDRTHKPAAEYCPLCPTKPEAFATEVLAEDYEIAVFENKFPSLKQPPAPLDVEGSALYQTAPAEGVCEVVLYTPHHDSSLAQESVEQIHNLIEVWTDRYLELGQKPVVQYVLIFEDKSDAVGVTLNHPHGHIYALPFIPPTLEKELQAALEHQRDTGKCLYCDILAEEKKDEVRIIAEHESYVAFVPFFARYPYEVHLYPKHHVPSLAEFTPDEQRGLAETLKEVLVTYDALFGFSLPYMMVLHQAPPKGDYPHFHFHIEFYPLNCSADRLKYISGIEAGGGTFITDMSPEQQAINLRRGVSRHA